MASEKIILSEFTGCGWSLPCGWEVGLIKDESIRSVLVYLGSLGWGGLGMAVGWRKKVFQVAKNA